MTSTTQRMGEGHPFPGLLKAIIISCDEPGCMIAKNDTEIQVEGGLKEMGWGNVVKDGVLQHFCPAHVQVERE